MAFVIEFDIFIDIQISSSCCMWRSLIGRIAPSLCNIISSGAAEGANAQPNPQVEGALDILAMILKNAPVDVAVSLHGAVMQPVMALMRTCCDAGQLQSGTEVLRLMLRSGGEDMLSWNGAEANSTFQVRA
eukprot:scaffold234163_cov23-Prasinocladus_malaysianus.AAC.1